MTKRISDRQTVKDFVDIAGEFCLFIEQRNRYTDVEMYQGLYGLLPKLCLSAMNLPEIERFNLYKGKNYHLAWKEIYMSLGKKFKASDDIYKNISPYQNNYSSKEPWESSISNDIAEIYQDIAPGLEDWKDENASTKRAILWDWKFSYETHWGDHATDVFRAIHSLLYEKITDSDDDYIGLRKNE